MAHNHYQPTDYEQMLIFAGWIDAGSVDSEYQEYRSRFAYPELEDAFLDYDQWVAIRKELDALGAEYDAKFSSLDVDEWYRHEREANRLLRQMTDIEIQLGY